MEGCLEEECGKSSQAILENFVPVIIKILVKSICVPSIKNKLKNHSFCPLEVCSGSAVQIGSLES